MRLATMRGREDLLIPDEFSAQFRARGFVLRTAPADLPTVTIPTPISELAARAVDSHPPARAAAPGPLSPRAISAPVPPPEEHRTPAPKVAAATPAPAPVIQGSDEGASEIAARLGPMPAEGPALDAWRAAFSDQLARKRLRTYAEAEVKRRKRTP